MQKAPLFHKDAFLMLPLIAGVCVFVVATLMQAYLLLFVPFAFLIAWWLLRDLRILYLLLLFSIPISTEMEFSSMLATDFPSESFMWLLTAALFAVFIYRPATFPVSAKKSALFLILLLQLAWIFITTILSYEPLLSTKHFLAKIWYIVPFVLGTLYLMHNTKQFAIASKVFVLAMLIPIANSWIHHADNAFSFEAINASLGPFFRNHVNYSALMVCMLPIVWALFTHTSSREKRWWAWMMGILFAAILLSYSRGAWLCIITALITAWALKKKYLMSLLEIASIAVLLAFSWLKYDDQYLKFSPDFNRTIYHPGFSDHMQATYQLKDISTVERFYRWIAGVRMVADEPVKGFGPASFYTHYRSYAIPVFETWVSNNEERSTVHNYFLLLAVEQGIPGLLIFILLVVFMYATAVKVYHQSHHSVYRTMAMVCAMILSMMMTLNFLSDLIETDKIGSVFYIVLATLIFLGDRLRREKESI